MRNSFVSMAFVLPTWGRSPALAFYSVCTVARPNIRSSMKMALARPDRRSFLADAAAAAGVAAAAFGAVAPAGATNFDIARYGDKELRIATINKLKQQIRTKLTSDPGLAPGFLKLAVNDALGYNARTTKGGPDGSVLLEMDREENKGLKPALDAVLAIQKSLQRTNEITLADVIAFAGGEAMQATGAPRVIVQLGRYDEKKAANAAEPIPGYSWEAPKGEGLKAAFKRAGMSGRDMGLLLCALGSVTDVVDKALDTDKGEDDDDLQDLSWQNELPNTFGSQAQMYGKGIGEGSFGVGYLERLLREEKKKTPGPLNELDSILLSDPELKAVMQKYVGNSRGFSSDVIDAYQRMVLLGEEYETRLLTRD